MSTLLQVEAKASHPDLEADQGWGHLLVQDDGLEYRPCPPGSSADSDGPVLIRLPLSGLKLRMGGAANRLILISHLDFPQWRFMSSDKQLIRHPPWQDHPEVVQLRAQLTRHRRVQRAAILGTLVVLVLGCLGFWQTLDPGSRWVAEQITPEMEATLGAAAFEQAVAQQRVIDDPRITAELDRLTAPLIEAIGSERTVFQFAIVEDESINAFALPGGYMAIHTGLILAADSPEQVLGVMAHELAHVTEQHSLRVLVKHLGIQLFISTFLGDIESLSGELVENAPALLQLKFSRDHETEADTVGFEYLERANIDPRGMIGFFEKIKAQEEGQGVPMGESLSILSTHPATTERIENMQRLIDEESHGGPYKYMDLNFEELQSMLRTQLATPE